MVVEREERVDILAGRDEVTRKLLMIDVKILLYFI